MAVLWRRLGLLRDHDYRGLFASTLVSHLGHQVTVLALPLVAVLALGAGEFQVGLLFAMMSVAFLLVGLPAGAWVDRMRRRHVLIVSDLARAALLTWIPVAWWLDLLAMWQLYVVALVFGVFRVFFDVAYQSYLPHLVGRDNLVEANIKLEGVRSVAQVAGPGLAGQVIQLLTAPVALLANAIALALSAIFVVRIRKREPQPQHQGGGRLLDEIGEGMRFVLRHRLLRPIAACTGVVNLFTSAYTAMVIVFLARELGLREGIIGLVFAFAGVGGLLGLFLIRRVVGWVGQGPMIWMSIAFTAPFFALMPLTDSGPTLWLGAFGLLMASAGGVAYNVTQVSFRQGMTPDRMLGRTNATMRFLVWGTMPVGGLMGGVLGQWIGIRPTLLVCAIGATLGFAPVFLSPLRTMRVLPQQPDPDDEALTALAP